MVKIKINLKHNSYYIFLQHNIFDDIVAFHQKHYTNCKAIIITDRNVKKHYLKKLTYKFSVKNVTVNTYSVLNGERSKSFKSLESLAEKIIKKGINRNDIIYAFGGGVVGDLTGFLSSIIFFGETRICDRLFPDLDFVVFRFGTAIILKVKTYYIF